MALIGNCKHVEYTGVEGEFTTETVTLVDGTVHEIERPVLNRTETEYNDVYCIVYFIQMDRLFEAEDTVKVVAYRYAVYQSREARDIDKENWLFAGGDVLSEYDYDSNVYAQCYNDIIEKEGLEDLIQD